MFVRSIDERGESLIEVVITMMFVGLAVSALVAGLGVATTTSTQHRRHAKAEVLVRDAAELLRNRDAASPGIAYVPTSTTGLTYALPAIAALEGAEFDEFAWTATVTSRLDQDMLTPLPNGTPDEGLQVIEIVVTDTDDNVKESASIIKRMPE